MDNKILIKDQPLFLILAHLTSNRESGNSAPRIIQGTINIVHQYPDCGLTNIFTTKLDKD
jgi:hypothetical protein